MAIQNQRCASPSHPPLEMAREQDLNLSPRHSVSRDSFFNLKVIHDAHILLPYPPPPHTHTYYPPPPLAEGRSYLTGSARHRATKAVVSASSLPALTPSDLLTLWASSPYQGSLPGQPPPQPPCETPSATCRWPTPSPRLIWCEGCHPGWRPANAPPSTARGRSPGGWRGLAYGRAPSRCLSS